MSNLILGRGPCPRPTIERFFTTPTPRIAAFIHWKLGKFTGDNQHMKAEGSFQNLIVNGGLDQMGTTNIPTCTQFMCVGTGSSTPLVTQTALDAEIGRVNRRTTGDDIVVSGPSFAYWSVKYVYLFLEAEANGNLTEVGFYNLNIGGVMFARQLFKDNTGTPTTVPKTINDQLQVTYEIRVYPPTVDTAQTGLVISGTSYDITTRARGAGTATIWGSDGAASGFLFRAGVVFNAPGGRAFDGTATLGPVTGGLSGANSGADTSVAAAYVNGNYYRDVTMKWEPTNANFASGIGGIHSHGGATSELFQSVFTPVFAKDATKRLTLVVRCSWARYP